MNQNKLVFNAMKEFQKKLEESNKKLLEDFQVALKDSLRDVEKQSHQKEEAEIADLESELDLI